MKTRLAAAIGAEAAARFYRAFLSDIGRRFSSEPSWSFFWSFEPAGSAFAEECAGGTAAFAQPEGDLGARMGGAMEHLFRRGYREVVLIGSDVPHLPRSRIVEAFERLSAGAKLVLGPAEDGGYYLVGGVAVPPIFASMRWSDRDVLERTLERARAAGLEPVLLAPAYDLDTEEDLRRLARERHALVEIPATAALLSSFRFPFRSIRSPI